MWKCVLLLATVVGGLWMGGCEEETSSTYRLKVDPADIPAVCAAYTACSNDVIPFGACCIVVDTARYWTTTANSFDLGTVDKEYWINNVSGVQNSKCMGDISNGTCEEALACANQGSAVRGCTPKEGYFSGRYCRDEGTLAACTPTGVGGETVEASLRCSDLRMNCLEYDRDGELFATCAYPAETSVEGIMVTCEGTVARIQTKDVYFTWDCALLNADCWPGDYRSWDNYDFCVSNQPTCTEQNLEPKCDGPNRVNWCNGRELGLDCTNFDQTCQQTQFLLWNIPLCVYPGTNCNPYSYQESCENGVITYCGPNGITTYDCKQHGYPGCTQETLFAHCQARDGG